MKKISILLCAIFALSVQLCLANESDKKYLFKNDFSTAADYINSETNVFEYSKFFSSIGLNTSLSTSAGDVIEVRDGGEGRGNAIYVSVEDRTSGIPSLSIPKTYTQNKDILIFEFDIKCTSKTIGYAFPSLTALQGWIGVGAGSSTHEDYRYVDTSVSGDNQWGNVGNNIKHSESAVWYTFKYEVDLMSTSYSLSILAEDGSFNFSRSNIPSRPNVTAVTNPSFDFRGGSVMFDNFKLYTMDKMMMQSSKPLNNQTGVAVEKQQEFIFSQPVSEASLENIEITGLEKWEFKAELKSSNTVLIKYNKHLEYDTEYTVNLSGVKATNGLGASGAVVMFRTEMTPDVFIKSYNIIKGFGETQNETDGFYADNSFQAVLANVANDTDKAQQITIMLALYNENGYLTKMAYSNAEIGANDIKKIGAGTIVPQELTGGCVKIYLWNDARLMKPWSVYISDDLK